MANESKAFLLTWKTWEHENILRLLGEYKQNGFALHKWQINAHTQADIGMPVAIYSQHDEGRGIFGIGFIYGKLAQESSPYFNIAFTRFRDPLAKTYINDRLSQALLGDLVHSQSSGNTIAAEQYAAIASQVLLAGD
ncbi:MAG: hypothetical protein LBO72_10055 [Helicobacteraceae bacterium]|jgi:hypothetical protein|nr:hypothetical protein [Helicobacteraceae bacterium]